MASHGAFVARRLVRRGDLTQLQLEQACADADLPLSLGQVRLRVERFALTAVTQGRRATVDSPGMPCRNLCSHREPRDRRNGPHPAPAA